MTSLLPADKLVPYLPPTRGDKLVNKHAFLGVSSFSSGRSLVQNDSADCVAIPIDFTVYPSLGTATEIGIQINLQSNQLTLMPGGIAGCVIDLTSTITPGGSPTLNCLLQFPDTGFCVIGIYKTIVHSPVLTNTFVVNAYFNGSVAIATFPPVLLILTSIRLDPFQSAVY